jgi:3-oxoacyl-[acyl-carrier-protein] synthase III
MHLSNSKLTLASENLLGYPVHQVHVVVDEKGRAGGCQFSCCLHAGIAQEAEQPGAANAPLALFLGFLLGLVALALVLLSLPGPV